MTAMVAVVTGERPHNAAVHEAMTSGKHAILIGTACTGLVRIEWALARYGQVTPCNWSATVMVQPVPAVCPLGFMTADAQNVICQFFMQGDYQWLFLLEEDNILPPDAFMRLNAYMRSGDVPVVSGLYFTKSVPSEPILYRGRGNSYYADWQMGEVVWCDAVPTGMLLVHRSVIKLLWEESEEYLAGGNTKARRVFRVPEHSWFDPQEGGKVETFSGTSDIEWCSRILATKVLERAGWKDYVGKKYPFCVDTGLFGPHIDPNGRMYPSERELQWWRMSPKERLASRKKDLKRSLKQGQR